MNNPIVEKYADVLVNYSTKVKKNDLVIIYARGYEAKPLVNEIYKLCLLNGANPVVRVNMEGIAEKFIKYATDEQLSYIDEMSKIEVELADVMIFIGAPNNIKSMAKADNDKLAKYAKATRPILAKRLDRSAKGLMRWVIADYPTNALAQEASMSYDDYCDFLIKSCYLDLPDPVNKWIETDKEQTRLANIINGTKKLHIVGDKTDITFDVTDRIWIPCSGNMNFPDGEIYTSPVENGTNGKIYFDFPQNYHGSTAKEVYIEFKNGRVIDAYAENGNDFFQNMINLDDGAKTAGEIAIGTNDRILDVTGNILFDEKIGGSIHMALGASYPETGGKNQSGLHWDLIKNMKNGGKIYTDDKLIYENGKFII